MKTWQALATDRLEVFNLLIRIHIWYGYRKRARRAAEFNFDLAKRAVMLNGATQIAITKMDVLYPECAHVNNYESMPSNAKKFLENIEEKLGVPVTLVGTGPSSEDIIDRRNTQ